MLLRDRQENFDNLRIELAAGASPDFLPRVWHREGPPIRPVADHGIERVGDGENTRPHRNLIASQAPGIARTVIKLLVREHNLRGIFKKWDANQHVVTDFAVRAHEFLFLVGKRAGFSQDAIGNGHLADVVEKRGTGQDQQIGIRNGHLLCNGDAERGNTLAMALGFRVLQVQRAAKGLQSVVVRLFELVESLLEPRGAIFHLLLEIALIFSVFVDKPAMLQRAAYAQKQLVLFKGLQDVVVGAATDGFERRGDVVDRRDHNDGHDISTALEAIRRGAYDY